MGLSWAPSYNTGFCLDIYSVSSSLFLFFMQSVSHPGYLLHQLPIIDSDFLIFTHPQPFFSSPSLSLSTLTFRRSHQTPGNSQTQNPIICALSLGYSLSGHQCAFNPFFFTLISFISPRFRPVALVVLRFTVFLSFLSISLFFFFF